MRAYLVIPILLLSYSCKSSDSSPTDAGTSSAGQDFVTQYCALLAPCCGATNSCTKTFVVPATFDPHLGDACLAALKTNAATSHFCASGALLAEVPACQLLQTRGTTPIGGACNDAVTGYECAEAAGTHVACVAAQGGSQLCETVTLGNLGDACVADSNEDGTLPTGASIDGPVTGAFVFCNRATNLHCGGAGKCIGLATLGQSCTDTSSCVLGAYCPFADPPTCLAKLADGAACTGDNDACLSGSCVAQVCSTKAEEGVTSICGGS